ncbi:MAG: PDZ domain-containing protein, partial [Brevundimonas sp.]
PWLGVKGETVSADIARSLGLERPQGVVVTQVWNNGPGERAGLREGDLITAIDGAEINDQGGLNFRVGLHDPNETVEVAFLRDGRRQTVNARVSSLPGDPDTGKATTIQSGALSGAQVLALNPALADALGGDPFSSGVIIGGVQRGSYANRVGFQGGDVVVAVNGRSITSVGQLANIGRGAEVSINRRGRTITGTMR